MTTRALAVASSLAAVVPRCAIAIGARARLPTSAPRRSARRARSSTPRTARSATATRATARATRAAPAPAPRNFTTGKFKIRTTPNGALPTTRIS